MAYYDTFPESDDLGAAGFEGAWSVKPYLVAGMIVVSEIYNGLFVLSMKKCLEAAEGTEAATGTAIPVGVRSVHVGS